MGDNLDGDELLLFIEMKKLINKWIKNILYQGTLDNTSTVKVGARRRMGPT